MEKLKYLILSKKIGLLTTGIIVLMNIISFAFLPDKMGVHFSGGVVDGEMPKLLFLGFIPVLNLLYSLYVEHMGKNPLVINIFFGILNCGLIFINLV